MKKTVLFICVHNSARSQIAEGLVNALYGDRFEAVSGGTTATRVHPGRHQGHGRDRHRHQRPSLEEHRRLRGPPVRLRRHGLRRQAGRLPFLPRRQRADPPRFRRPGGLHRDRRRSAGLLPQEPGRDPGLDRGDVHPRGPGAHGRQVQVPLSRRPLLQRRRGLGPVRGVAGPYRAFRFHPAEERRRRLRRIQGAGDAGQAGR